MIVRLRCRSSWASREISSGQQQVVHERLKDNSLVQGLNVRKMSFNLDASLESEELFLFCKRTTQYATDSCQAVGSDSISTNVEFLMVKLGVLLVECPIISIFTFETNDCIYNQPRCDLAIFTLGNVKTTSLESMRIVRIALGKSHSNRPGIKKKSPLRPKHTRSCSSSRYFHRHIPEEQGT